MIQAYNCWTCHKKPGRELVVSRSDIFHFTRTSLAPPTPTFPSCVLADEILSLFDLGRWGWTTATSCKSFDVGHGGITCRNCHSLCRGDNGISYVWVGWWFALCAHISDLNESWIFKSVCLHTLTGIHCFPIPPPSWSPPPQAQPLLFLTALLQLQLGAEKYKTCRKYVSQLFQGFTPWKIDMEPTRGIIWTKPPFLGSIFQSAKFWTWGWTNLAETLRPSCRKGSHRFFR